MKASVFAAVSCLLLALISPSALADWRSPQQKAVDRDLWQAVAGAWWEARSQERIAFFESGYFEISTKTKLVAVGGWWVMGGRLNLFVTRSTASGLPTNHSFEMMVSFPRKDVMTYSLDKLNSHDLQRIK